MNMFVMRTAAFAVGSAIAGCVYATQSSGNSAALAQQPIIAVYPGAHQTSGNSMGDGADVDIHLAVVSIRMHAARYDTVAKPASVVDFYKKELARLGRVTVSKGGPNTHVKGFMWSSAPDQMTVTAHQDSEATEDIVAVAPHGSGSEFAIIRFRALGSSAAGASPGH